ncbi:cyclophilin-like domain-containing protein, partial [Pavlovales sp. CCMP2436]
GSLVFRVDPETAPRTCEHFMSLLDAPTVPGSSALLGSAWHRVAPGGFAQGGVLSQERGAVWEKARAAAGTDDVLVADESFATLHDASGVLGFANSGPHTIGTQIYVTFAPMPTLDRKYVAFGKLVDGLSVLRALEGV